LRGLFIDGANASGANANGLHIGNGLGFTVDNVIARNFTGEDSAGIWVDDSLWWTEKAHFRTQVANCTNCYLFTNEGATAHGSLEYSLYDMVAYWTSGQTAFALTNSSTTHQMFWGGCSLFWRGNCNGATPGPFLSMAGAGDIVFKRMGLLFVPECNSANSPATIADLGGGGNHTFVNCWGAMDFGSNNWGPTTLEAGNLSFSGSIQVAGDTTLQALRTGVTPPAVTAPAIPAANTNVTNNFGVDVIVYIPNNGTGLDVTVAGNATGLNFGTFHVRQGSTINLGAYTVAPGGWVWHAANYP
jgi:hypothetical protein